MGLGSLAPRANVSFTTFAYVSPVQTIPLCDQTGTPAIAFDGFLHFRSSDHLGVGFRISARMRARVSARQSPRSRLLIPTLSGCSTTTDSLMRRPKRLGIKQWYEDEHHEAPDRRAWRHGPRDLVFNQR